MTIEKTLVLLKPDAVERGLVGEIVARFERVGLRLHGLKLLQTSAQLASDHYGDLDVRYSPKIKQDMVDFLTSGPTLAMVLEGVGAISQVRKMVGETYPDKSLPGTIRGDFAHVSREYANGIGVAVKNLIHASSSPEDAANEIALWFKPEELLEYETVHERHTRR